MQFRIIGAQTATGSTIQMTVGALDRAAVEKWAAENGIAWTAITQQPPSIAQSLYAPSPSPQPPATQFKYSAEKDIVNWLVGAIAVLLGLMISQRYVGFFDPGAILSTLGAAFACFLFVFIFGFVGAKFGRHRPSPARIGFAIGALGILSLLLANDFRIRQQRIADVSAMAQNIAADVRSLVPNPGPSERPTSMAPMMAQSNPNMGGMSVRQAEAMKILLAEVQAIYKEGIKIGEEFQQRLREIVGDGLLQPHKLDSIPKLALARSRLLQVRQLVDKRENDIMTAMAELPRRINSLDIDPELKRGAIQGYQERMSSSLNAIRQLGDAERKFVAESNQLADFMQSRLGRFRVVGDTIYFDDDADIERYRAIGRRVDAAIAEEDRLTKQMQQNVRVSADQLDKLFQSP